MRKGTGTHLVRFRENKVLLTNNGSRNLVVQRRKDPLSVFWPIQSAGLRTLNPPGSGDVPLFIRLPPPCARIAAVLPCVEYPAGREEQVLATRSN